MRLKVMSLSFFTGFSEALGDWWVRVDSNIFRLNDGCVLINIFEDVVGKWNSLHEKANQMN